MRKVMLCLWVVVAAAFSVPAETFPYQDSTVPLEERVRDLVGRMTLDEKVEWVTGFNDTHMGLTGSLGIERLGLPNFRIVHGPYMFKGSYAVGEYLTAGTYFPVSIAQASTWDINQVELMNAALGAEMKTLGAHANAGPAMCIIRDPRGGRSFEYFTEDPYLNGQIAAAYTRGLQSQKVMANLKHFACNNQEFNRHRLNVKVSERALREVYLAGFKTAIQEGGAWSVMGAYNKINGVYSCENPFLLTKVLRDDWGFKGFVLSDWSGTHSTAPSANAGLDLEMPREDWYGKKLLEAVHDGEVSEETVTQMAANLLRGSIWAGVLDHKASLDKSILRSPKHLKIARETSVKSMVLLKNNNNVLPFDRSKIKKVAVIGPSGSLGPHYFDGGYNTRIMQGGGSAFMDVDSEELITPIRGVQANAGAGIDVIYAPGCYAETGCGTVPAKYLRTPDGKDEGLLASYYNNDHFAGEVVKTEVDTKLSHEWRGDIPIPEPTRNNDDKVRFSVIWTGTLHPPETRTYTFSLKNFSGNAELFINGKQIVANLKGNRLDFNQMAAVNLKAGEVYDVKVKYAKTSGMADVRFQWDYENVKWMKEAVALAKDSDAVLLTVGLTGDMGETEAGDRKHLRLFPAQEKLINAVGNVNPNTAVAIIAGSAIDTRNWMESVPSILMAWYPGQEGGNAIADVIFGDAAPGGRLPITFPKSVDQYPEDFHVRGNEIDYKEGVFVGYRYFDKHHLEPLFPFGYGLTYTTFDYSDLKVTPHDRDVCVEVAVKNTGARVGEEVVQLYVRDVESSVERPEKELKGFKKVSLKPGETQTVTFDLTDSAFAFWSDVQKAWTVETGQFEIRVGSSSESLPLRKTVMR